MSVISDLVNIEEFDKKNDFNEERGEVTFYCKDCRDIVPTERPNEKGYIFVCKKCKGTNVSIGTNEGIKSNYRIKN